MSRFRLTAVSVLAALAIGVAGCEEATDVEENGVEENEDEESRIDRPDRLDTAVFRSDGAGYIQATITGIAIGTGEPAAAEAAVAAQGDGELAAVPVRASTIAAPPRVQAGSAIEGRWTPAMNMCAVVWVNVAPEKISTSGDIDCTVTDRLQAGNGYELAASCAVGDGEDREEMWMITAGAPGMITLTREGDDPVQLLRCP